MAAAGENQNCGVWSMEKRMAAPGESLDWGVQIMDRGRQQLVRAWMLDCGVWSVGRDGVVVWSTLTTRRCRAGK